MNALTASLAVELPCALGEGPVWDGRLEALYLVDIEGRRFVRFTPRTSTVEEFPMPDLIGALALTPDPDRVLVALRDGLHAFTLSSRTLIPYGTPPGHRPGARFNDCQVDPCGRLWAGTSSLDRAPATATLYRITNAHHMDAILEGLGLSNGMGWSPDGTTFFHIDTPTRRVRRFRFEPATGEIADLHRDLDLSDNDGFPDGMAIDSAGRLWIAFWDGACVRAFDQESGAPLIKIPLPVPRVTSCAFGGPDFRDLYITTAGSGVAGQPPLAGSLFHARVDVPGAPSPLFRG